MRSYSRGVWATLPLAKGLLTGWAQTCTLLALYWVITSPGQLRNFIYCLWNVTLGLHRNHRQLVGNLWLCIFDLKLWACFELLTLLPFWYLEWFYGKMAWGHPDSRRESGNVSQKVGCCLGGERRRVWPKAAVCVFPRVCSCHNARLVALEQLTGMPASATTAPKMLISALWTFSHYLYSGNLGVPWEQGLSESVPLLLFSVSVLSQRWQPKSISGFLVAATN